MGIERGADWHRPGGPFFPLASKRVPFLADIQNLWKSRNHGSSVMFVLNGIIKVIVQNHQSMSHSSEFFRIPGEG